MKSMRGFASISLTLLTIVSLITSPLLTSASHVENTGFVSHGFEANPSYAFPSYAFPSYAFPEGGINYNSTTWGMERIFPTLDDYYTLSDLKEDIVDGNSIQIAVLDTGIYNHPEFGDSIKWTYDATGNNDMTDVSGHGTHIAGIINSFAIAEIYAIKVMDGPNMEGEWDWLEEGIYAAIRGPDGIVGTIDDADIINMSLGSQGEVPPIAVEEAIKKANNREIILIASAGNDGDNDIDTDDLDQYPAAYSEVIAVGAIDENNNLAPFSNTNSYIEVVAPGVNILSTFKNGDYAIWSGTSMAAPYMAALSAFLLYRYGYSYIHYMGVGSFEEMRYYQLRGFVHQFILDLGTESWDKGYGYGLIQYEELRSDNIP